MSSSNATEVTALPPSRPPPSAPASSPTASREKRRSKRFVTRLALLSTVGAVAALGLLAVACSGWSRGGRPHGAPRRALEQEDDGGDGGGGDGDYASYRCEDIFTRTPSPAANASASAASSSAPTARCRYARTCEGTGLLLAFPFCRPLGLSLSPPSLLLLLSPPLLLLLALLFRLLGSTADEYFAPALAMFSAELGLPPRFAGASLLALGNGAADVSATLNAIAGDPADGYRLALGALTGAAMFITTAVAGAVVLANGGAACRGALVRDVTALAVAVAVVARELRKGEVGPGTTRLFISMYVLFVLVVLVADVYHRRVMLPRVQQETELHEHQRRREAEGRASDRATDPLNAFAGPDGGSVARSAGGVPPAPSAGGGGARPEDDDDDARTHATAPDRMEYAAGCHPHGRALDRVLTALSNYNADEHDLREDAGAGAGGWGGDAEGARALLRAGGPPVEASPYHVMEDPDGAERRGAPEGSPGPPAHEHDGAGAWRELTGHFLEHWRDILEDDESGRLEKFLLMCEFPLTVARKLTVSIPCEGSYCRALVATSFALSPLWLGVYLYSNFGVNIWGWNIALYSASTFAVGLLIVRYAPGGGGPMPTILAVAIALYGFVIAATWIDWIANRLVSLLQFLGVVLRIPNYIMGLTVLAWGNSMADLSANVTMARKGFANMAITACFAGPLFNILVGLGAGFGVLRGVTKTEVNDVHLTPSITTGFVFCFISCGLLLVSGLVMNKGMIPAGYGYAAITLYGVYIVTSLSLQFLS